MGEEAAHARVDEQPAFPVLYDNPDSYNTGTIYDAYKSFEKHFYMPYFTRWQGCCTVEPSDDTLHGL